MSWLYTLVFAGLSISTQTGSAPVEQPLLAESPAAIVIAADETENFEKTYPLNANGRVNLSNVNGSITVVAWDRNEVKLQYTKIADSKERLADVEVRIDSRADYFGAEVDYGNWRKSNDGWRSGKLNVEFRLMVPRGAMLNEVETVNGSVTVSNFTNYTCISAVNGSVKASNLRGTAKLSTVNGEVAADFDRLDSGTKIALETVNGRVNLVIPSDSNATLRAESLNGTITNDFGLPVHKGKYVGRDVHGRIGSGDVQIKMESVNGTLNVNRRNDGKSLNPAVNLFNNKNKNDDDNWDDDKEQAKLSSQMNKDIAKAVKDSQKVSAKALANARVELDKIAPEMAKVAAEAAISAIDLVRMGELQDKVAKVQALNADRIVRLAELGFSNTMPRIERKSGNFVVKGIPTVTINAKRCNVKVTGWDKPEVSYSVTQFANSRNNSPLKVAADNTESTVNINVDQPEDRDRGPFWNGSNGVRIEVFVPKKSNLKVMTGGELRVDGVSGNLELTGADETINVRDSDGKLIVTNGDGQVRIVGFRGELVARTGDGEIRMDGDFTAISGQASDGTFVLTVPDDIDADIYGSGKDGFSFRIEDIESGKQISENNWKFGKGSRKYTFKAVDGSLVVQNRGLIDSY